MWDDGDMENHDTTFTGEIPLPSRRARQGYRQPTSILAGLRISACTVLILSICTLLAWFSPWEKWAVALIVAAASCFLSVGWPAVTGTKVIVPSQIVVALSGMIVAIAGTLSGDMMVATCVCGFSVIGIVATEILTTSKPCDYSGDTRGAHASAGTDRSWEHHSTSASLMSSLSALVVVIAGSSWVALASSELWRIGIPIACVIVACTVWGDQLGSSFRTQSVGAFSAAVISGAATSLGLWYLGTLSDLTPVVFPVIAAQIGDMGAMIVLGVVTAIAVALVIIVLDGFLGDRESPKPPLGALARGSAKFLVAALPIYIMFRIGGI